MYNGYDPRWGGDVEEEVKVVVEKRDFISIEVSTARCVTTGSEDINANCAMRTAASMP